MTVCWRCQQPGADARNRRGEPVHRDCIAAYLAPPSSDDPVAQEVYHVEDTR